MHERFVVMAGIQQQAPRGVMSLVDEQHVFGPFGLLNGFLGHCDAAIISLERQIQLGQPHHSVNLVVGFAQLLCLPDHVEQIFTRPCEFLHV